MRAAIRDLRVLFRSAKAGNGFPYPFEGALGRNVIGGWRNRLHVLAFGQWRYTTQPRWRMTLAIPLRPWRYARMVRSVARTRNRPFASWMYDDVD